MSKYYGDIIEDDTIEMGFNTFNSSGASVTVTNLADTDIHVHKDGGLTQTTTGATVAIDYDGITGNHLITIVTTDAFYVTGSNYEVRLEGITVDSQTINAFIGSFSIENRFMRGTDSANTVVPPTEAQMNARTIVSANYALDSTVAKDATVALDATVAKDATVALDATVAKDATVALDATVAKEATINTKIPNNLNTTATGNIGVDWANVENQTASINLTNTDIQSMTGNVGGNVLGAVIGAVGSVGVNGITATSIATDAINAASIKADAVTKIQNGLATATNVTTAHSTTDGLITTVDTVVDAIKVVTDNLADSATTIVSGTVAATASSTTIFFSDDVTEATADHYNGRIVIFTTSGVGTDQLVNQATDITDYELVGGEGKFTVTALTEAPADNDTFVIV